MTDTKPRTAEDITSDIAGALDEMFKSEDPYTSADIGGLLESWRRELLADGWTYLPEMPEIPANDHRSAEVLVIDAFGVFWLATLWDDGSFHDSQEYMTLHGVYAWRPLPEPPPVKGDG